MAARTRLLVMAALAAATVAGLLVLTLRPRGSPTTWALVEETTLVVLRGEVQLQRNGGSFGTVTDDTIVRVGDRIRTGPDGFASVTYFDGSSTSLEPNTDIILRRLEPLPLGRASISFQQELGLTWNRVERLIDANSRFEVTTSSAIAYVRGTEFIVRVDTTGRTIVEAVTDAVTVEAAGVVVIVQPGFQTTVDPGQPPSEPVRAQAARFGFQIDIQGPVRPLLTDDRNRSVGFHPTVDAYANQIRASTYSIGAAGQRLHVPDPVASYELALAAQEGGGSYTVTIMSLIDGQPVASRARGGLARPLAAEQLTASIGRGARHGTGFEYRDRQVRNLRRPPSLVDGPPRGSNGAIAKDAKTTGVRVVETAVAVAARAPQSPERPTPTARSHQEPTPDAVLAVAATETTAPTATGVLAAAPTRTQIPSAEPPADQPSPPGAPPTATPRPTATATLLPEEAPPAATPAPLPEESLTATPVTETAVEPTPTQAPPEPPVDLTPTPTPLPVPTAIPAAGETPSVRFPQAGAPAAAPVGAPADIPPAGPGSPVALTPVGQPPPGSVLAAPAPPAPTATQLPSSPAIFRPHIGGGGALPSLMRVTTSELLGAIVDVTFSTGVFTNADGTGRLVESDFVIADANLPGLAVVTVSHEPGEATAILILSGAARPGLTTLRVGGSEIFDSQGRPVSHQPVVVAGPP